MTITAKYEGQLRRVFRTADPFVKFRIELPDGEPVDVWARTEGHAKAYLRYRGLLPQLKGKVPTDEKERAQ